MDFGDRTMFLLQDQILHDKLTHRAAADIAVAHE